MSNASSGSSLTSRILCGGIVERNATDLEVEERSPNLIWLATFRIAEAWANPLYKS